MLSGAGSCWSMAMVFAPDRPNAAPDRVERADLGLAGVALVDAPILGDGADLVSFSAAGEGGVGVLASEGVVGEDEAAVDGGRPGLCEWWWRSRG